MPSYKLTDGTSIYRVDTETMIGGPDAPGYDDYLVWVAAGGVPLPADLPVPTAVSPRQIRQALTAAGLRAQVEAAVASGNQDLKDWWEFATVFERQHPMIAAMAQQLNVSTAQLDEVFVLAASK